MNSGPGFEALRRGRVSSELSRYFLTLTTHQRRRGLNDIRPATCIREECESMEADETWTVLGAVIMPDHLHVLVAIGTRLTLGQTIGRLKSRTRAALDAVGLRWQANYFDHRLHPDDSIEEILRYLFLNPYRAELLTAHERYTWFWLGPDEKRWFQPTPSDELPQFAWMH